MSLLHQDPTIQSLATIPVGLDIAAVALGAVQGAVFATRMAEERKIDVVGIGVVGIATALGGGIVRDVLINQRPAAITDGSLIVTAVVAAFVGMLLASLLNRLDPFVVAVDAAALGMWVVVGSAKGADADLNTVAVICVGMVTCVGGSVIRDILLQVQVALMKVGSFYALAALAGAVTFVTLDDFWSSRPAGFAAGTVTFILRMGSIRYGWKAPQARPVNVKKIVAASMAASKKAVRIIPLAPARDAVEPPGEDPDGPA